MVPEKLVGKAIGVQGRRIQSYEMHYAVDIRLELVFLTLGISNAMHDQGLKEQRPEGQRSN